MLPQTIFFCHLQLAHPRLQEPVARGCRGTFHFHSFQASFFQYLKRTMVEKTHFLRSASDLLNFWGFGGLGLWRIHFGGNQQVWVTLFFFLPSHALRSEANLSQGVPRITTCLAAGSSRETEKLWEASAPISRDIFRLSSFVLVSEANFLSFRVELTWDVSLPEFLDFVLVGKTMLVVDVKFGLLLVHAHLLSK